MEIERGLVFSLRLHLHRRNNGGLATRAARQRRCIEGGGTRCKRGLHHLAICGAEGNGHRGDEPEEQKR